LVFSRKSYFWQISNFFSCFPTLKAPKNLWKQLVPDKKIFLFLFYKPIVGIVWGYFCRYFCLTPFDPTSFFITCLTYLPDTFSFYPLSRFRFCLTLSLIHLFPNPKSKILPEKILPDTFLKVLSQSGLSPLPFPFVFLFAYPKCLLNGL